MNNLLKKACTMACMMSICMTGGTAAAEPPTAIELQTKIAEFTSWYQIEKTSDRTLMGAKLEEVFADTDFSEIDLFTVRRLQRYFGLSKELSLKLGQRLITLGEDPGPQGAAAYALAIGAYFGDSKAMTETFRATINHPAFEEALKQEMATEVFQMIAYLPDETLIELKDDILKLESAFDLGLPVQFLANGTGYIIAIAKLYEHIDVETRDNIHSRMIERMKAAAENADNQIKNYLQSQQAFLNTRYPRGLLLGHPAPEITFKWSHGTNGATSLADFKGKVVVLDFWATWCGPCIESFPKIAKLQEYYNGYEVVILGVTSIQGNHNPGDGPVIMTEGNPEKEFKLMSEFIKAKDMTWAVVFSDQEVSNPDFGVLGIPHMAIIDPDGVVRYNGLNPLASSHTEKAAKINKLLEKAKLPTPALPAEDKDEGDS